jgi:phage tail protein X
MSPVITVADLLLKLTWVRLVSDPLSDLTCWHAAAETDAVAECGVVLTGGDGVADMGEFGGDGLFTTGPADPVGLAVLLVDVVEVLHAARSITPPTIGTAIGAAAFHQAVLFCD